MLRHLSIQNFAIIESIEIDFESGLNIILGETGTGKSILMDSLSILLGEKALTSYVRENEKKAVIEGIFELSVNNPIKFLLEENGFEIYFPDSQSHETFQLIIRREISVNGNSRIFINDTPSQYSLLKVIGDLIIDFHGQFEHQSLINSSYHINILDAYCGNFNILKNYQESLQKLKLRNKEYLDFISKKESIKNELISNQKILDEINEINPKLGEDLELEKELKLSENSELINSLLYDVLSELVEENSINYKLVNVKKKLETLSKYEDAILPFYNEINDHIPFFKELGDYLKNYFDDLEFQPQKIDEINQRLFNLNQLKRKYGTIEEIHQKKSDIELFILKYTESATSRNIFEENLADAFNNVYIYAQELSHARQDRLQQFEEEFLKTVQLLGFQHIEFLTNLKSNTFEPKFDLSKISEFTTKGIDNCEFLISTNLGEKPKELSKIASGGELSRIILSLKSLAAADKNLPILVFDEIDSGVSGRIAQKVGELMKNLSQDHQLICITHSPQIAAAGDSVISIEKIEKNGRTISIARQLNQNEIKMEIAKFLSGANVSDSSLLTAEDLIKNYKN